MLVSNFNAHKIFLQELDLLEWLILFVETRVVIDCYSVYSITSLLLVLMDLLADNISLVPEPR